MVVKGRDGLLLRESKGPGQARPTSRATASRLFTTLVSQIVCCGKSFASMTHHHAAQPQTQGKTREVSPKKKQVTMNVERGGGIYWNTYTSHVPPQQ